MATVIKCCRGEKRGKRKIDAVRRKLMIPDSEITECPQYKVKSKIGNIFVNEKILEEYSVKNYEIDPYCYKHYRKEIQTDENGCKSIYHLELMFIFLNISQPQKLMKNVILTETLFLKRKDKKHQKKKLGCKFVRINTSK